MKNFCPSSLSNFRQFTLLFFFSYIFLFSLTIAAQSNPARIFDKEPFADNVFQPLSVGDLDTSFNGNGIRIDGYGYGRDEIHATAIQSDGKIVVAGKSVSGSLFPAVVARYNSDGSFDTTFGSNGVVSLQNSMANAFAVRIQTDGKIVIAGNIFTGQFSDFAIVRLNPNGTFDNTFDVDGRIITAMSPRSDTATGLAIQPDGKIIAVGFDENPNLSGFNEFAMARYNINGSLDATFGTGGKVNTLMSTSSEARAVALQMDGKIVVGGRGGTQAPLARYNVNGTLDSSFDGDGIVSVPFYIFNSVAIQSDNKIIAAGAPNVGSIDFAVLRFNSDGSPDLTFDSDGIASAPENFNTNIGTGVVVSSDGKITVTGGNFSNEAIAVRFNDNGSLDTNFGTGGKASAVFDGQICYVNASALQADGKLIIAGNAERSSSSADFTLVRLNSDGSLDTSFDTDGKATYDIGNATMYTTAVAVQPDGKIITAGRHTVSGTISENTNFAVFRYNTNGTLDSTFDADGKLSIGFFDNISDYANSIVLQPDGKIIVAGYVFNSSFTSFALVRLNQDGSFDTTFNVTGKVLTDVSPDQDFGVSVALQSNGKIVVGGYSGSGSTFDFSVARYNSDGSLDTSFNNTGTVVTPVGTANDQAYSVLVQPDEKIILAGYSSVNNSANFSMVRYNVDGTLDGTFGNSGKVLTIAGTTSSAAFAATLQRDGKILLGGSSLNPNNDFALARYNPNGSLDTGFGSNGIVTTNINGIDQINALAVQPDNKIIAVGETTSLSAIGYDYASVRYNPNGSLDTTWGGTGKVVTNLSGIEDRAQAVALTASGNIILAGRAGGLSGVVRYIGDSPAITLKTPFDFDGDGKTDISIFRPSAGEWWYSRSSDGQVPAAQFGAGTDKPMPGDYTGDGKTDIAFFRPSTGEWFILRSENGSFFSFPFGTSGDVPAPSDYDGDGKTDAAVFRPSTGTWFILNSSGSGTTIVNFGIAEDKPVAADYDGDGKSDIAIYRPSEGSWWYLRSSDSQFRVFLFGVSTDKPVQGDWTGDGKADIAVYRPSNGFWYVQRSEDNSFFSVPFGTSGDIPTPGDYDGDGRLDFAVFRPSAANWYVQRSTAGLLIQQFGLPTDVPLPSVFVP